MKIVLLPGLDGTGMLFKPLIDALPSDVEPIVITYPLDEKLTYSALCDYVMKRLPKDEDYVLLGESFSGPIAYAIALLNPKNMKSAIFVASFLSSPRPIAIGLSRILPKRFLLSLPMPRLVIKAYLLGSGCSEELMGLFRRALKKVSPDVLIFRLNQIANLSNKHQCCDKRAIYIQAKSDKLVSEECVTAYKEVVEDLHIFQVEGPHFILQASSSACAEIVINEMRFVMNHLNAQENR